MLRILNWFSWVMFVMGCVAAVVIGLRDYLIMGMAPADQGFASALSTSIVAVLLFNLSLLCGGAVLSIFALRDEESGYSEVGALSTLLLLAVALCVGFIFEGSRANQRQIVLLVVGPMLIMVPAVAVTLELAARYLNSLSRLPDDKVSRLMVETRQWLALAFLGVPGLWAFGYALGSLGLAPWLALLGLAAYVALLRLGVRAAVQFLMCSVAITGQGNS